MKSKVKHSLPCFFFNQCMNSTVLLRDGRIDCARCSEGSNMGTHDVSFALCCLKIPSHFAMSQTAHCSHNSIDTFAAHQPKHELVRSSTAYVDCTTQRSLALAATPLFPSMVRFSTDVHPRAAIEEGTWTAEKPHESSYRLRAVSRARIAGATHHAALTVGLRIHYCLRSCRNQLRWIACRFQRGGNTRRR